MEELGTKIRIERKKSGLTLKQLAHKVRINPVTLHRIETGKSSPSIILLSEIAQELKKSIYSFFEEEGERIVYIKRKNQRSISNPMLKMKLIGPRKMIKENIIVTYVELKKGKTIDPHTNPGIEFAYNIEGKCEFKLDGKSYFSECGDSISFNAKLEHSLTAIEKLKFVSIYVEDKE